MAVNRLVGSLAHACRKRLDWLPAESSGRDPHGTIAKGKLASASPSSFGRRMAYFHLNTATPLIMRSGHVLRASRQRAGRRSVH